MAVMADLLPLLFLFPPTLHPVDVLTARVRRPPGRPSNTWLDHQLGGDLSDLLEDRCEPWTRRYSDATVRDNHDDDDDDGVRDGYGVMCAV